MRKGIGILIMLLLASSCYRDVVFEVPGGEEGLLVNAQMSAADEVHSIFVGRSTASRVYPLHSAVVTCSVNGGEAIRAEEVMVGGRRQVEYRFGAALNPGDIIAVEVSDDDERTAGAEVSVPELTGEIVSIDTSSSGGKFFLSVKIRDNGKGRNYYMLTLDTHYKATLKDIDPVTGKIFDFVVEGDNKCLKLKNVEDPILNGGHAGGFGEDDVIGSGVENVNCAFTNLHFPGGEATVEVYVDSTSLYEDDIYEYYIKGIKDNTAIVSLHSISKQEYDYLWTLNTFEDSGFHMSSMMEPAAIVMNVNGGYGFVSVSSCDSKKLGLKREFLTHISESSL